MTAAGWRPAPRGGVCYRGGRDALSDDAEDTVRGPKPVSQVLSFQRRHILVRKVEYFYTSTRDESAEGFRVLSRLAARNVDLMALTAVPFGPDKAQFTMFPTIPSSLIEAARAEKITLDGPHFAILVQGIDHVGAFAGVLSKLAAANVDVYSIQGMIDGRGGFSYIIYVKPSDIDRALKSLARF